MERWAQAAARRVAVALHWGNPCNRNSAVVASTVGVAAEAPEGVHLGKIGL